MKQITLGKTGITVPQCAFGALPVQRVNMENGVKLLRRAHESGMTFFDTARAYSDSEAKLGEAFGGNWDGIYLATKTGAKTVEDFWRDLNTSLKLLKRDYIDIYQFHCAPQCYKPGDGTGLYEAIQEAKAKGLIHHIGITAHKIGVAEEAIESGLYETLQFPFSYISSDRDLALAEKCKKAGMGFIAMKGLAGGLLNNSKACMAFMNGFDNVVAIWGIQREHELDEWLSFFDGVPEMTDELRSVIEADKKQLGGDFCRSCGYCMPCTVGIQINQCARMSQMVRRAPSAAWLNDYWQAEMARIDSCVECGLCSSRCPYGLNTPELLKKNLTDYREILAGKEV